MKYFCYQGNDKDCGFASLKMLLATLSKNRSYLFIKKKNKIDNFTFYDLKEIAKSYYVTLEGYTYGERDLRTMTVPCLCLLENDHLVMVRKIKKRKVIYLDPDLGEIKLKQKEFLDVWQGKSLEVIDAKNVKEIEKINDEILPQKKVILRTIFSAVPALILSVGFYLINESTNIIFLVAFLLLFAISELLDYYYLIKIINYFDNKYIFKFFSINRNKNKIEYQNYEDFKTNYFSKNRLLLSAVISGFLLICICSLNDLKNLLVFAAILLIELLDKIVFSSLEKKMMKNMTINEEKAFTNVDQIVSSLSIANKDACEFAKFKYTRKCVMTFILIIFAILMMYLTNNISINYLMFHFGIYYIVSNNISSVISYLSSMDEFEKSRFKFLDRME